MDEKTSGIAKILLEWKEMLLAFGLAAFFGGVRYLQDYTVGDEPPAFKWFIAAAKILIAGATGLLTAWICQEWQIGPYMSAVMIATSGYGGAEALNIFKEGLRNALTQLIQPRRS